MQNLSRIFKALSDETRLSFVSLLCWEKSLCVCDFMAVLDISQPNVSRHMKILAEAGIVEGRREGVWVHYSFKEDRDDTLTQVLATLEKRFAAEEYAPLRRRLQDYLAQKNACCGVTASDEMTTAE